MFAFYQAFQVERTSRRWKMTTMGGEYATGPIKKKNAPAAIWAYLGPDDKTEPDNKAEAIRLWKAAT